MAFLAVVGPRVPNEKPAVVGTVDLDFLHRQANAALETLRHPHKERHHLAVLMDAI